MTKGKSPSHFITYTPATTITNDTWYKEGTVDPPNVKAPKITTMTMESDYKGDIVGVSVAQYAFADFAEQKKDIPMNNTTFIGMSTFEGSVLGKKGTFAATITGDCKDGYSSATITIVEGTGTGELKGITGNCSFRVAMEDCKDLEVVWDVEFP